MQISDTSHVLSVMTKMGYGKKKRSHSELMLCIKNPIRLKHHGNFAWKFFAALVAMHTVCYCLINEEYVQYFNRQHDLRT